MKSQLNVVATLLRLSSVDKDEWESAIQLILKVVADVLEVDRVSYWCLSADPPSLVCEMAYVASDQSFERGMVLDSAEHEGYFEALRSSPILPVASTAADVRLGSLADYFRARGIGALLDVSVWSRGARAGVLCHESGASERAWTQSECEFAVAVGQVVSSALEARRRSRAEESAQRSAFLDRVSRTLAELAFERQVGERALGCLVPDRGDWSVLDLVESGEVRRLAYAHATAEGRVALAETSARYPPSLDTPHLTARVIRVDSSILLPEVTAEQLAAYGIDDGHADLLHTIGTRTAMAVPLRAGGKVIGAVSLNATQLRYTHEDLHLFEQFAERVAVALANARLLRQVNEAVAARNEFISLAAHELRTPLTALRLAVEVLTRATSKSTSAAATQATAMVVRQTKQLSALVDRMLDLSRPAPGEVELDRDSVDLSALAREVAASYDDRLRNAGCALRLDADGPVVGHWDRARIRELLGHLIDNAIKFGRGEPIAVSVRKDGVDALLTVEDKGQGVPPESASRIFEPFERAVSSQHYGGLGLGLFLARGIARAHGGEIRLHENGSDGACFVARLPRGEGARQYG